LFILTVLLEVSECYCGPFEQDFVRLINLLVIVLASKLHFSTNNLLVIVLASKLHFSTNISSVEAFLYYVAFLNCCGWVLYSMVL